MADNELEDKITSRIILHRGNVFRELINYYKRELNILKIYFQIEMVSPNGDIEMAADTGGVFRDALSEFWGEFYLQCTAGNNIKVPILRHDFAIDDWQAIAKIIIVGWNQENYFPIYLAKGFLASCLYGEDDHPIDIDEYLQFLTRDEKICLETVLHTSSSQLWEENLDEVLDILGEHECKKKVTADNLKTILNEIGHKELIQEPTYIKNCWQDIFNKYKFSEKVTNLSLLKDNLIPTCKKVVAKLQFTDDNSDKCDTGKFLKKFVKELDEKDLAKFLRFVTGSNLLSDGRIQVDTVSMSDFTRRPVAHTCGRTLELGNNFENYATFRTEFKNALDAGIWVMDIV